MEQNSTAKTACIGALKAVLIVSTSAKMAALEGVFYHESFLLDTQTQYWEIALTLIMMLVATIFIKAFYIAGIENWYCRSCCSP